MKILILSLAFAPYSGVGTARMTSLTRYLIAKGNQVTVACYDSKMFGVNEQAREIPYGTHLIILEKINEKWKNIRCLEKQIEQIVKAESFDICISSVGPYDTMFFIHKMQKKWGVPYIIDYRDVWLFEKTAIIPRGLRKCKTLVRDLLFFAIEKRDIKWATKVVLVTQKCKQDLVERYCLPEEKCEVIYNGYEDIPEKLEKKQKEEKEEFVFAIAGKFSYYNEVAAQNFMEICKEENTEIPIKVMHIGICEEKSVEKFPDIYECKGVKSHIDAITELQKADAFIVTNALRSGLGTKIFDYIALNKPIVYVGTTPAELADFVEQFDNSYVCETKEEMKKVIRNLIVCRTAFLTNESNLGRFSRECQNEIYYSLIKKMRT